MNRIAVFMLSCALVSCAHLSPLYWGWGEWVGPGAAGMESGANAAFDWSSLPGVISSIDGTGVGAGYTCARLVPGRHALAYAYQTADFGAHPQGLVEVELQPGHAYEFNIRLCFWCTPRTYAVWVDDTTTGELVWGRRPDWPFWYL